MRGTAVGFQTKDTDRELGASGEPDETQYFYIGVPQCRSMDRIFQASPRILGQGTRRLL